MMSIIMPSRTRNFRIVTLDDQEHVLKFVRDTLGDDGSIQYTEYSDADEFLQSEIDDVDLFIIDKVFESETRVNELINKIRAESRSAIIVLSNDPDSDIFDERVVRLLKGRVFLGPSLLRTEVLKAIDDMEKIVESVDLQKAAKCILLREVAEGAIGQTTINEIRLENIGYPLKQPTPVIWNGKEYSVAGLEKWIVGKGDTASMAMRDFVRQFHGKFVRLYREMAEDLADEDRDIWNAISRVINLDEFLKSETIVVPYEHGQIKKTSNIGVVKIHWLTRDTTDIVEVENVPDLAALEDGDYLSAIVRRRSDESLVSILHAHEIAAPFYKEDEIADFWNQ